MSDQQSQIDMVVSTELTNSSALEKVEATTQLDDRNVGVGIGSGISPPYEPAVLAGFLELNSTHSRAVAVKSLWEVGFGFGIVPHPRAGDTPDESQKERVENFWYGRDSNWKLGPEGTAAAVPEEVLACGRRDWHGIGWLSLEILTNNAGEPIGLAHVPSTTTRVRKSQDDTDETKAGTGYVQVRDNRTVYYGEAGDRWGDAPTFVDRKNGTVHSSGADCPNGPANELLFVVNPSSLSLYYGIPEWVSTMTTMVADEASQQYNREFFEHSTVPYLAIIVKNGSLSEQSRREIRSVIHGLKGEPHRTVLLEAEKIADSTQADILTEAGEPAEIEIQPLGMDAKEDMSFEKFRERNEHDISKIHGIPPQLLNNLGDSNRSNIKESIRAFANQQIAPNQSRFAERLYRVIHVAGLDAPDWTIEFELRGADTEKQDAEIAATKLKAAPGIVTVNEARDWYGLDPLDGALGEMMVSEAGGSASGMADALADEMDARANDLESQLTDQFVNQRLMDVGASVD